MAKSNDVTQIEIPLPDGLSADDRLAVADEIIEYIVDRTRKGKDKDGNRFPAYSESYKRSLSMSIAKQHGGKSPRKVDLELSGDMLAALSLVRARRDALVIGYKASDGPEKARAEGNILGSYGGEPDPDRARDFLGITPEALATILRKYRK